MVPDIGKHDVGKNTMLVCDYIVIPDDEQPVPVLLPAALQVTQIDV